MEKKIYMITDEDCPKCKDGILLYDIGDPSAKICCLADCDYYSKDVKQLKLF